MFAGLFGIESLTSREIVDLNIILTIGGHLIITAGFFCSTALFYNEARDRNKLERERFFEDFETPVVADETQDEYDRQQRAKLGAMAMIMGGGLLLMTLIPNPPWGRMIFVGCALVMSGIGFVLRRSARRDTAPA